MLGLDILWSIFGGLKVSDGQLKGERVIKIERRNILYLLGNPA